MQDNCKITARLLQDYKSKRANGRWVSQWVSEITGYWAPFGAKNIVSAHASEYLEYIWSRLGIYDCMDVQLYQVTNSHICQCVS